MGQRGSYYANRDVRNKDIVLVYFHTASASLARDSHGGEKGCACFSLIF